LAPFELFISLPPVSVALEARPREEELSASVAKQEFLERLKTLSIRARGNFSLHKPGKSRNMNKESGRKLHFSMRAIRPISRWK
jgi:hypothetical protein